MHLNTVKFYLLNYPMDLVYQRKLKQIFNQAWNYFPFPSICLITLQEERNYAETENQYKIQKRG